MERLNLSARAYDRILKVAELSDLDAAPTVVSSHIAEAFSIEA
jgi:magnesium chelatase family protein